MYPCHVKIFHSGCNNDRFYKATTIFRRWLSARNARLFQRYTRLDASVSRSRITRLEAFVFYGNPKKLKFPKFSFAFFNYFALQRQLIYQFKLIMVIQILRHDTPQFCERGRILKRCTVPLNLMHKTNFEHKMELFPDSIEN